MTKRILPPASLNWESSIGRRIKTEDEWRSIKEAVDSSREGPIGSDEIETLIFHGLWDTEQGCVDDENVNNLYMRYT